MNDSTNLENEFGSKLILDEGIINRGDKEEDLYSEPYDSHLETSRQLTSQSDYTKKSPEEDDDDALQRVRL